MSELVFEKLSDESLAEIAGGTTPELRAAYSCIRGDYGNGEERRRRLGSYYSIVQSRVNEMLS